MEARGKIIVEKREERSGRGREGGKMESREGEK